MPVSFYTPSSFGTAPKADLLGSLVPPLAQGIYKAAQMYRAGKEVDQAAKQAATLFKDPAIGNVFRQMGLAAVANGESPTPVINSMLSTALKLRQDEETAARQERMQQQGFGQQIALENLRSQNDLGQIQARSQAEIDNVYQGEINRLGARADFQESPTGQRFLQSQQQQDQVKADAEVSAANRMSYARQSGAELARNDYAPDLPIDGGTGTNALFDALPPLVDSNNQPTPITPLTPLPSLPQKTLDQLHVNLIDQIEKSTPAEKSRLQTRLNAVEDELELRTDKRKMTARERAIKDAGNGPRVQSNVPPRYVTP